MKQQTIIPSTLGVDEPLLIKTLSALTHVAPLLVHFDFMDGTVDKRVYDGISAYRALSNTEDLRFIPDFHFCSLTPTNSLAECLSERLPVSSRVSVHVESDADLSFWRKQWRKQGVMFGLSLFSDTRLNPRWIETYKPDFLHVVTTNSEGSFSSNALETIAHIASTFPNSTIVADGGVTATTLPSCIDQGATEMVAGSAVFKQPDPVAAYEGLHQLALESQFKRGAYVGNI
jgi:ribulose-phosphate 3-epimerase